MSLRKLFWDDPYRVECDARVVTVKGDMAMLDQTIFCAFSGGQESDAATIGGRPVLAARKEGLDILYTLAPDHGLVAGDAVKVVIDWDRRYRLKRLHFAAEFILELMYRKCPGVGKIGAHIAAEKSRIDFVRTRSVSPLLPSFTEEAQALIRSDLPIESAFSDVEAQRRYWKIEGFSQVPCGGTHLKRPGEVGSIRLKRDNVGKGKERFNILLD